MGRNLEAFVIENFNKAIEYREIHSRVDQEIVGRDAHVALEGAREMVGAQVGAPCEHFETEALVEVIQDVAADIFDHGV